MSQKDLLNLLRENFKVTIPSQIRIDREKIIYSNKPFLEVNEACFLDHKNKNIKYSKFKRPDFVQAVLMNGEEILFQLRYRLGSQSFVLELPGGGCDKNETPVDAITRELKEEIHNIEIKKIEYLGSYYMDPMRSTYKGHFFRAYPLNFDFEKSGIIEGEIEESTFFWMNKKYIKIFKEIIPMSTITAINLSGIKLD